MTKKVEKQEDSNYTEQEKEQGRRNWDDWLGEMSDREQPDQCSIDNPDCEACGS